MFNVYVMWENFVIHFATAETEFLEKSTIEVGGPGLALPTLLRMRVVFIHTERSG